MKKLVQSSLLLVMIMICSNGRAQKTGTDIKLGTSEGVTQQFSSKKMNEEFSVKVSSTESITVRVTDLQTRNGQLQIFGAITGAESSVFYINFDSKNISGVIKNNDKNISYQIETLNSNEVIVRESKDHEIISEQVNKGKTYTEKNGKTNKTAAIPLLNTKSGAAVVVYLDFDGEDISKDKFWTNQLKGGTKANPTNFDANKITQIWATVAEDYRPFNINVTTDRAVFNRAAYGKRVQVIYTNNLEYEINTGGYSDFYIISNKPRTDKCFVFTKYVLNTVSDLAQTAAHESGHAFDLRHDGDKITKKSYWRGHGNVGAIMGSNFDATRAIYQWNKGEYEGACDNEFNPNTQDDIAVIASKAGFRGDEQGNDIKSAKELRSESNGSVLASNNNAIIERREDKDVFSFSHAGGKINLKITSGTGRTPKEGNLDIQARLLNSSGKQLVLSNPGGLDASINTTQPAGRYYLEIDGVGNGDPYKNGYSGYGSIGSYKISGNFVKKKTGKDSEALVAEELTTNISGDILNKDLTAQNSEIDLNKIEATSFIAYPNPFSKEVTLNFSVQNKTEVSISIYNISGSLIKSLVSKEVFEAGQHTIKWDTNQNNGGYVQAGIYICQLMVGDKLETIKLSVKE